MNVADWIEEQRTLINDGVAVSMLRLVGADDSAWGTWPITLERLGERVETAIASLADELPTGKHAVRLIALDSKGLQVASLPRVIVGRSAAAKGAQTDAMNQAKAHSILVQSSEQQLATMGQRAEDAERRAMEVTASAFELADAYLSLKQSVLLQEREDAIRAELAALARELLAEIKPLIAVLSEFVGQRVAEYMHNKKKG
jgi:hypothetical protein